MGAMEEPLVQSWDLFRSTENEANSASEKNTVLFQGGRTRGRNNVSLQRSFADFEMTRLDPWISVTAKNPGGGEGG